MPPLIDLDTGVAGAVFVLLAAAITQLYLRIGKLEDRIKALETEKATALQQLHAAASFINRVGLWVARGSRPPMPEPPAQILPHIDAELWETPASPAEPQPWAE